MCIGLRKFPPKQPVVGMLMILSNTAPNGTATVGADPAWFIVKNLHVIGTMVGSMRDTDAALGFAARVCFVH
jgi:propanol-preferring alcohol dehydrogenase